LSCDHFGFPTADLLTLFAGKHLICGAYYMSEFEDVIDAVDSHETSHQNSSVAVASAPQRKPKSVKPVAARKSPETSSKLWAEARAEMTKNGLAWPVVIWLSVVHVGALFIFVPALFSWAGVATAVVFHWLTGGIGVCLGYHRYFTHKSFETPKPIAYLLAAIGGLSGEGCCLDWVATHREHHAHSDQIGDPHSPHDGPWWSHMFWVMIRNTPEQLNKRHTRWIPDLKDDKVLQFISRMFIPLHITLGLIMMAVGYYFGGWQLACSLLVWGMFARLVFVLHTTWFVNSASHMWGYRNYETTDDSRNNWWVALISYGEGWHNNHHAYPRMARHGHKWWEFDMTFLSIRLMEKLGLASDVVDHQHNKRAEDHSVVPASDAALDTAAILKAHRQPQTDSQHHG
jgi:stearoyl-CoA desaturase (delta-9 desaturase)